MSDEAETKPEETVDFAETDAEKQEYLNKLKDELKTKYGDNFDEKKFEVTAAGKSLEGLKSLNENLFQKEKDDNDHLAGFSGANLNFNVAFKDGQYTAEGPNGEIIKNKDLDDFHKQLAQKCKNQFTKENNPKGFVIFRLGEDKNCPVSDEKYMESVARNFINEGVAIAGDLPKNPEFWNNLKQEYLQNKENTEEIWNNLTRYVPRKSMGLPEIEIEKEETKEGSKAETNEGAKKTDKETIKQLLALSNKGYNPHDPYQKPPFAPKAMPKNIDPSNLRPVMPKKEGGRT